MINEYGIATDADLKFVSSVVERSAYVKVEDEVWGDYVFRNANHVSMNIEEADETLFDLYQSERGNEKDFVKNPRTFMRSSMEEILGDVSEQERLVEEGKLDDYLDEKQVMEDVGRDFEVVRHILLENGHKVDFYIINEGFDI